MNQPPIRTEDAHPQLGALTAGSVAQRNCILTAYPLTRDFKSRILGMAGPDVLTLTVSELRLKPLPAMLRYLRSLRVERVLLPIEQTQDELLLPVLKMLAALIRSKGVDVVNANLVTTPVSMANVASSLANLGAASAIAYRCMRRASRDVEGLLAEPRINVEPAHEPSVLYLNPNLWFGLKAGGSVGHVSGVANGFAVAGMPTHLVSASGRLVTSDDVRYSPIEIPKHFGLPWEYNSCRVNYSLINQAANLMQRERLGLIYQRLSLGNFTGVALSRQLKRPLIIEYNGSEAWVAKSWGRPLKQQDLAEKIERVNLRHAHLVVTVSDVLRDELIETGVAKERIVSYPNCIEPEMFDPARFTPARVSALRRKYDIPDRAIVASFLGTFGQWHGAPVLAVAIRKLLDERQDWVERNNVRFMLVGDGVKMPEVRQALGRHADGPFVALTGLVPQVDAPLYLAASDILCSPHVPNADGSRFFGSPTKLFEYMAMGKAIIASDLDQIGEVLAGSIRADALPHAGAGTATNAPALLAEPGSADEICAGLEFLIASAEWRNALGENARRLALERYTWRRHVGEIIDGARRTGILPPLAAPGNAPRTTAMPFPVGTRSIKV